MGCGNRVTHQRTPDTTTYANNEVNEYESIGGTALYYDAAGNLTRDEDGYEYAYDYENRLTQVTFDDGETLHELAHLPAWPILRAAMIRGSRRPFAGVGSEHHGPTCSLPAPARLTLRPVRTLRAPNGARCRGLSLRPPPTLYRWQEYCRGPEVRNDSSPDRAPLARCRGSRCPARKKRYETNPSWRFTEYL